MGQAQPKTDPLEARLATGPSGSGAWAKAASAETEP